MAKILVVDDSHVARMIIIHILKGAQHTVLEATDGRLAQAILQTETDIDLLITDIYMTEMDGPELTIWLRQQPVLQNVPVIMMTASGEYESELQEKTVLADGVLTKPVSTWNLLTMINDLLGATE